MKLIILTPVLVKTKNVQSRQDVRVMGKLLILVTLFVGGCFLSPEKEPDYASWTDSAIVMEIIYQEYGIRTDTLPYIELPYIMGHELRPQYDDNGIFSHYLKTLMLSYAVDTAVTGPRTRLLEAKYDINMLVIEYEAVFYNDLTKYLSTSNITIDTTGI